MPARAPRLCPPLPSPRLVVQITAPLAALLFALLLAALALPSPALAHRDLGARKAVATARLDGGALHLDVMVWLRLAGERATVFRGRYDLDRSGDLGPAEAALLGDALAPEAIGGLVVRREGKAQAPVSAEAKARLAPDGAIEVAVLLSWSLGPLGPLGSGPGSDAATVELAVRADRDRRGAPVIVAELAALPPLRLVDAPPATGAQSLLGPTPLVPGAPGLIARFVEGAMP